MADSDNVSATASEISALGALERAETAVSSAAASPAGSGAGDTSPQVGAAPPETTPGATAQPAKTEPAAQAAATGGEAPQHRIEAAVRNARAEVERRFAWAKDLNPQEAQSAIGWMRQLRANPQAFLKQLMSEVGQPAAPEAQEAFPEPDYTDPEGKAQFYSASSLKKALDHQKRAILAEVNKGMKPMQDEHQRTVAENQQREVISQATSTARQAIAEARKLEHFKANEKAISETLAAMDPQEKARLGPVAALHVAYSQVLQTKVLPGLRTTVEEETRQNYAKKAAASVGVNPSDAGGAGKKPVLNNVDDLQRHMERLAGASV